MGVVYVFVGEGFHYELFFNPYISLELELALVFSVCLIFISYGNIEVFSLTLVHL